MLISYEFKNYMSYLDECNFTMSANSDKLHPENLIINDNNRISKVKVIYGANASGKTSFISSLAFIQSFVFMSNRLVDGNRIAVRPFRFTDKICPSEFSISFIKNNIKYHYSFSCTSEKVINEKLDVYNSSKATNIFTRTDVNHYKFNNDIKMLNELKTKNTDNKLFLVTAATWNYDKVKPVVDFLMNDIAVLYDATQPTQYSINYIIQHNDLEEYKKFCLEFLNNADISISGFEINPKKIKDLGKDAEIMTNIFNMIVNDPEEVNKFTNSPIYNIKTYHKINTNNIRKSYALNLNEESIGTQQLFHLAPILFYVFKGGKTLFVDEIDRSLHPILVKHIVRKFLNKEINKNGAQLICNTHDTNLLDLELLRRDEIWFTDRDVDTGISKMFALSDFSPRKDENIEKAYMLGRFGAVPFILGE